MNLNALPKLFLVDDDALFAMLTKKKIMKIGYTQPLKIFVNGLEILNHITTYSNDENNLPDIILLDLNMPIMDGWQFLDEYSKIKIKLPKKISIYILSSSTFPEDIRKANECANVIDYIMKPITEEKLKSLLAL